MYRPDSRATLLTLSGRALHRLESTSNFIDRILSGRALHRLESIFIYIYDKIMTDSPQG